MTGLTGVAPMKPRQGRRCPQCHRLLLGRLDRVPRWPIYLAVGGSLVYPGLRILWVVGSTIGTTGGKTTVEPALAWSLIALSSVLVAFTFVLLMDKGSAWLRTLLGFGGLLVGLTMVALGGLGTAMALSFLSAEGPDVSPGAGLTIWTFLVVYCSWFVTGLGVTAGSWRYWVHRREDCSACRRLLR
jgi:hypothetical protein